MTIKVGLLNIHTKVEAFRSGDSPAKTHHYLLQTDWQAILSELLSHGVSLQELVDVESVHYSLSDVRMLHFDRSPALQELNDQIVQIMRARITDQDRSIRKESERILNYLTDGWKACLIREQKKLRAIVSQSGKDASRQRREDKLKRYHEAMNWLNQQHKESDSPTSKQLLFCDFKMIVESIEKLTDKTPRDLQIHLLELVQQYTFEKVNTMSRS